MLESGEQGHESDTGRRKIGDGATAWWSLAYSQPIEWTGDVGDFPDMPTVSGDPIVESGSNSDGEWTRWADGTQVCIKNRETGQDSGQFFAIRWNLPKDFTDADYSFSYLFDDSDNGGIDLEELSHPPMYINAGTDKVDARLKFDVDQGSNTNAVIKKLQAIGRWK